MRPVGYLNDSTVLLLETGRRGEIHPAQKDGIPPHAVFTADQIRSEIEAVRAEFDTGPEEGGWSRIVLDALKVRLGIEP